MRKGEAVIHEGAGPTCPGSCDACLRGSEESLKNNTVPTLIVVGEHDPEKPTVDELRGVMKNMRIKVIPDVDHFGAGLEQEFIQTVVGFLKAHPEK